MLKVYIYTMLVCYIFITLLIHLSAANTKLERISGENCTFSIDGHIYDFSDLAKEKHWEYSEVYHDNLGSKRQYYISICHYIKNIHGCQNSNVCFTNNKNSTLISGSSGGKSSTTNYVPELLEEGHLKFLFTNGSVCKNGRAVTHYSTELYLQCPLENDDESNGPVLMSSSSCTLIFVWITKDACPQKHKIDKSSCILNISDTSINLNSLKSKTFYAVNKSNFSFEINICGPITNGSCPGQNVSVCDISNKENPQPIALIENENIVVENENINMKFKENNMSTNIEVKCDQKILNPEIIFKGVVLNKTYEYLFEIKTAFACRSMETNCILHNSNNSVIDLRSLRRNESNWEVYVSTYIEKKIKRELYLLNICGPLINREDTGCPVGTIGACKPSITVGAALNLGYITSEPTIATDGTINILYTGGDPCNKYAESSSTKIILICSKAEHLPVLLKVTSSCLHIFEWHTPSACPMSLIIGTDCKVKDPLHGEVFDLNPLRHKSNDYLVKSEPYSFLLNVCGPLLSYCDGRNSSVCTVGINRQSGGKAPGTLLFDDGTLIMEFDDGSSCNDGTWRTKILILCSHVAMDTVPQYFHTNNETCTHIFIWHTFHACPSFTTVDCFIQDENNLFDLSPLSNPVDNWVVDKSINGTTKIYVFNICRSVVHSKEFRCPYKAGSCLMDQQENRLALSLGNVVTSPYISNDTIMIRYTGGSICTNRRRYQTLIIFECVPWSYNSIPILMKDENCEIVIKVRTSHACPQKLLPEVQPTTGNCSVINPLTKYVYNMNSLRSFKPFKISNGNNGTIFVNVCGQIEDRQCSPYGSGSCLLEDNNTKIINMGSANSDLKFSRWHAFLEYKDGDSCYSRLNGKMQRSTKISFVCSENKQIFGPVVIDYDEDTCILYINWHTVLACEREINCFAKTHDGRTFDLSPFAKYYGNYEIVHPNNSTITYYINVCKPLNPIKGIRCHPGSAACMVGEENGNARDVSSLGHVLLDPVVISNNDVVLMYSHGSSCPVEGLSSMSYSSRITFVCNRTVGVGAPVFVEHTHDCQFKFEWHTSVVCENDIEDDARFGNQCQIYLEKAKANTDIMPLYKVGGYTVSHGNKTYKVNVCGPVCNNSGVCTEDGTSYGLVDHVKMLWDNDMLKLAYYTGDPCSSSLTFKRSSRIYFECDMTAGYGSPVAEPWNKVESCVMVFSWKTNVTCLEAIYKPEPFTEMPISSTTTNLTIPSTASSESGSFSSGNVGLSILIAASVGTLVLLVSVMMFLRSLQGRRITTQAKGFFRRKGDEIFLMDDQHLQDI